MTPVALTIAGSDPSGGAGIQADLKTFHQHRVYGEAVITLITVQNSCSVDRVEVLAPDLVRDQIGAVLRDIPPAAIKTGALGNAGVIEAVAGEAWTCPLVVDPVMISKHGAPLIAAEAQAALRELLIPRATLVTPNLPEAMALTGFAVHDVTGMRRAAEALVRMGCRAALIKGGHLEGQAVDLLSDGAEFWQFPSERIDTPHTHGTGCTYSAAIAANLAKGFSLVESVARAKTFIAEAIRSNPGLGRGQGPVNHFAPAV